MVASILQTVSVMIGALSFVLGITAWRRSLLGQRKIDLAETVHEGFEDAAVALRAIRSPFAYVGEGSTRKKKESETEAESEILNNAYVAIERYNKRSENFSNLLSKRHRFSLYFGDEAAKPFDELDAILSEILKASGRLSRLWRQQGTKMSEDNLKRHLEKMHTAEAIFWEGSEEPDPLNPRIEQMLNSIRSTCKSIVNPRRSFCADCKSRWNLMVKYLSCSS